MKKSFLFLALISLILSFSCKDKPNDSSTQTANWEQLKNYPVNGNASKLALVGNTLIASDYGNKDNIFGIRTSIDLGASWTAKNSSFGKSIEHLVSDGINLYSGKWHYGIYKSSDLGQSWNKTSASWADSIYIWDICFSGTDLYVCGDFGILNSPDSGATWNDIGIDHSAVISIAASGNTIFACIYYVLNIGIYKSIDKGVHWTYIGNSTGLNDNSIAIYNGVVYATSVDSDGGKIYTSSDMGVTWKTSFIFDNEMNFFPYDFAQYKGTVFLATNNGVYRSVDNGETWSNIGGPFTVSLQVIGNTLFAGTTNSGIWKLDL